jgi:hypothetical protein
VNKQALSPRDVVADVVLTYSAAMPRLGHAAVLNGSLLIATKNHHGQFHAEVWKLAPSILHDMLHAFVTIVGVPEGLWATKETA